MLPWQIKEDNGQRKIFDVVRKKYVLLTPEEEVRQKLVHYLIEEKGYPKNLLILEHEFKLNGLSKRADIVVTDTWGNPLMIIETKAPNVTITQKAVDQVIIYNMHYKTPYLLVTNGRKFYMYHITKQSVKLLQDIPLYSELF